MFFQRDSQGRRKHLHYRSLVDRSMFHEFHADG